MLLAVVLLFCQGDDEVAVLFETSSVLFQAPTGLAEDTLAEDVTETGEEDGDADAVPEAPPEDEGELEVLSEGRSAMRRPGLRIPN